MAGGASEVGRTGTKRFRSADDVDDDSVAVSMEKGTGEEGGLEVEDSDSWVMAALSDGENVLDVVCEVLVLVMDEAVIVGLIITVAVEIRAPNSLGD